MAYCGKCGASVVGGFCGSCGARSSQTGGPVAPPAAGSWSASPAAPPPSVRSPLPARRGSAWLVAAIAAGALLLAAGGYAAAKVTILKDATPGSASSPAVTSVHPTPTSIPVPPATASPSSATAPAVEGTIPAPTPTPLVGDQDRRSPAAAYAQLEALVGQDATRPTVRGQWVAQLSSKADGVVDKTLQPGPFTVPDILAEHQRLRENPTYGSFVRLVHLGDWGGVATPASPMWVTVGDINGGSSAEVTAWCEATFAQRGKALNNVCLPRRLTLKSR